LFHILSVEQLLDQLAFSDLFDEYSIKGNYLKEEIDHIDYQQYLIPLNHILLMRGSGRISNNSSFY